MGHKCFISYKKEDKTYKNYLVELFAGQDVIDKSLDRIIDSEDGDYIMGTIRNDYLSDSTVTIFLIGQHSSENEGNDYWGRPRNYFIQRELQASLYNGIGNTRNGVLGIVLPEMYDSIYKGSSLCSTCGQYHDCILLNDTTVIREFSANFYTEPHASCAWTSDEEYCVIVKWSDFISNPTAYIDKAYDKRYSPIASKIRIRNLR